MTRQELEQYEERAIKLEQLLKHPGWAVFVEQSGMISERYYSEAVKAPDAHTMATRMGAHSAIKMLLSWPLTEIEKTKYALEHPEEYLEESLQGA